MITLVRPIQFFNHLSATTPATTKTGHDTDERRCWLVRLLRTTPNPRWPPPSSAQARPRTAPGGVKRSAWQFTASTVWFQRREGGGWPGEPTACRYRGAPYHPGEMPSHTCGAAAARRSRRARRACPAAGRGYTSGGAGTHTRHEHRGGRCSLSTWQPKVMPPWRHGLFSTAVAQRAACHERRGEASAAAEVSEQRARPRESLQARAWVMGLGKGRPA